MLRQQLASNHLLPFTLPDGRTLTVTAGYIDWVRTGIAVKLDGSLIHESHPGKTIAYPARAARMVEKEAPDEAADIDLEVLKRNKLPIGVDIALGLFFYFVAKMTDLQTAAIGGAVVGLALYGVQRATDKDLLGGLAMFGIVMSIIAAALALMFQDDDAIKWRSTVMGLIGATLFLADGLAGGKKIGAGMARYLPYRGINVQRLAIGMGIIGLIMAGANVAATYLLTTDGWLFYTTFVDFPMVAIMAMFVMKWARSDNAARPLKEVGSQS